MSLHEIVLPETRPETEWVRGRALQKVSPTYRHGRLQYLFAEALTLWAEAGNHGRVGTEWRFRVTPPGELTRPLVPDVAFLAYVDLSEDAPYDDVAVPLMAPTVAVEILSPDDRPADVLDKLATYLACGSAAVIVVDPEAESIVAYDATGAHRAASPAFIHAALPGLTLDLPALFARARR
jgi:Uma2 family endonuclease